MARKSLIERNAKRQQMYGRLEQKRSEYKAKVYDKNLSLEERYKYVMALAALPRNSAKNRIRNICALTGRSRGYFRDFGISRIILRELAGRGEVPGLRKSSW